MKAITVCVEYDDLLAVTLPRNLPHFDRMIVVTSSRDAATRDLVARYHDRAECFVTDAFYEQGCAFNKGAALELGFDCLGRDGWICVLDADIVLPAAMDLAGITRGNLHTPRRRMCREPGDYTGQADWSAWPVCPEVDFAGYFQLFHASDPVLSFPWYPTTWRHAGGCDSEFQARWPKAKRKRLPFEVLHLGRDGINWHGRATRRLDGTVPEQSETRIRAVRDMHSDRRLFGFAKEKLA